MLWQEWSKQGLNAVGKVVADTDLTCHRQACLERSTAYDTHGAYTVELTDISHWE